MSGHQDYSDDFRGYASREDRDADIERENDDREAQSTIHRDYWRTIREANADYDCTCAVAAGIYGKGSLEYAVEHNIAEKTLVARIFAAQADKAKHIRELNHPQIEQAAE